MGCNWNRRGDVGVLPSQVRLEKHASHWRNAVGEDLFLTILLVTLAALKPAVNWCQPRSTHCMAWHGSMAWHDIQHATCRHTHSHNIYTYIHVHTYMIWMCLGMYICIYICVCLASPPRGNSKGRAKNLCVCVVFGCMKHRHIHTQQNMHIHAHAYIYICMYVCMYKCARTHVYNDI